MVLEEVIADDLQPLKMGGVALYPADSLERIFDWAQVSARELQWVEGMFYRPDTDEGQLSLSYTCERGETEHGEFRLTCTKLAQNIMAEASAKGMDAYFEIGITA